MPDSSVERQKSIEQSFCSVRFLLFSFPLLHFRRMSGAKIIRIHEIRKSVNAPLFDPTGLAWQRKPQHWLSVRGK